MKLFIKYLKTGRQISLLYLLIFVAFPLISSGQELTTNNDFGRFSINASLGNHSVGFPFQNQFSAFNPVLPDIGLAFRVNKNLKHRFLLGLNTTFVNNEVVGNEWKTGLNLNYRYTNESGFFGKVGLDIGSISTNYSRQQFEFNTETANYESINQRFNSSYSGYRLAIGYDFENRFNKRYSVFLAHQFYFQTPYFQVQVFEVLPQNIIQVGIEVQLNKFK